MSEKVARLTGGVNERANLVQAYVALAESLRKTAYANIQAIQSGAFPDEEAAEFDATVGILADRIKALQGAAWDLVKEEQ